MTPEMRAGNNGLKDAMIVKGKKNFIAKNMRMQRKRLEDNPCVSNQNVAAVLNFEPS